MAFEYTKIDDNLSDEEFIIEYQKQNYRRYNLLSEEQIDELVSTKAPKERSKKLGFYINQALNKMKQKNREFSL